MPDYVHRHRVRFQLIYCYRGSVRVVYEDQGPPFVLQAGDAVLQPPEIRHRVLESSAGLEVIEVSCPAEHETLADLDWSCPRPWLGPSGTSAVSNSSATRHPGRTGRPGASRVSKRATWGWRRPRAAWPAPRSRGGVRVPPGRSAAAGRSRPTTRSCCSVRARRRGDALIAKASGKSRVSAGDSRGACVRRPHALFEGCSPRHPAAGGLHPRLTRPRTTIGARSSLRLRREVAEAGSADPFSGELQRDRHRVGRDIHFRRERRPLG